MPFFDKASASIFKELFFIAGLLPSLSVGPDPAIMSTKGTGPVLSGSVRGPYKTPIPVFRLTSCPSIGRAASGESEDPSPAEAAREIRELVDFRRQFPQFITRQEQPIQDR